MAQGNLKVKAKNTKHVKGKSAICKNKQKQKGLTTKGHKTFKPVNAEVLKLHKVKKGIQKGIHRKIEEELSKKATQLEEGKPFKLLETPKFLSKDKYKKEQKKQAAKK